MNNFSEKASFIWGAADLLHGDYKQSEYGRVVLPFIVLRRLDQVLALSREAVWAADEKSLHLPEALRERMLMKVAGVGFYNASRLDILTLLQDPDNVGPVLLGFLHGFSQNVRDIMERFRFESQITPTGQFQPAVSGRLPLRRDRPARLPAQPRRQPAEGFRRQVHPKELKRRFRATANPSSPPASPASSTSSLGYQCTDGATT